VTATLGDIDTPEDMSPLEWKSLPGGEMTSPLTGVIGHDDADGTITALVAVSGVVDEVGDVIVPGSLEAAIKRLKPKGVMSHNWGEKVSKLVWSKELMPGDPMLPKQTPDGQPWPANAGGLLIKARYNLDKQSGRDAYADAKFYGPEECFSIGYKVRPGGARMRNGKRYLHDFDLYEWSQVLHGAHRLATLTGVKSLADTIEAPWYDGTRSGDIEGDTALPADVETKVRVVRDADFWHLPVGTPIKPGMVPHGLNRPPTAQELHSTTAETGDDAGVHGAPDDVATPGMPGAPVGLGAPPMPDMALPTPGPKDGDVPTGDPEAAVEALRKRVGEIQKLNTPAARTAAAALTPFLVPGAPVRASADGQLVAVHTGDAWRFADTANGGVMQATLPGTLPQPNVDVVLHDLSQVGIPWDSVEARRKRWSDNPAQLQADKTAVAGIFARGGLPPTTTPAGVGGAGMGAPPPPGVPAPPQAPNAPPGAPPNVPGAPPNAPGLPVGAPSGYAQPPAVPPVPPQAAPAVTPPPAGAPPVSPKTFPRGSLKGHGVQLGDRIRVHGHPKGTLEGTVETGKTGHHLVHDDGTKTWIGGAGSRHHVEKLGKAADQPPRPQPAPEPDKPAAPAAPAAPEPYQATGNINAPHKLTDEQLATESAHAAARYARARANGAPKTSVEHHDAKLGHTVFQDEIRRRATGGEHTPDAPPTPGTPPAPDLKPVSDMTLEELRTERRGLLSNHRTPAETARLREIRDEMTRKEDAAWQEEMATGRAHKKLANADGPELLKALSEASDEDLAKTAATWSKSDSKRARLVKGEIARRAAAGQAAAPDKPGEVPEGSKPADTIRVPPELADGAHKVRADALGIIDGPDGQEELTPEVADRQDRVQAHLAAGETALADKTDDELPTIRKDLTDELALQNELARRDIERRKEVAAAKAGAPSESAANAPAGAEDTGPKLRPGVAGAAEDLGDALNAKPRDDATVHAAAERFAKMLRRHGDSKSFDAVRAAAGDDIHAAIASGELRAGMLFTAAGGVREERRLARNEGAKKRRLAKRLDRDRIKALIGAVDTEIRSRKDRKRGAVETKPSAVPVASTTAPSKPRAAAEAAIRDGDRIALVDALREMGDPGPRETAMRLRELPEDEAVAGLADVGKPASVPEPAPHRGQVRRDERDARLAADDNRVGRAQEHMRQARAAADDGDFEGAFAHLDKAQELNPERQKLWDKARGIITEQRDRAKGAQSPETEGGDHERPSGPDRGVVPEVPTGGLRRDQGQTGVLSGTDRPGERTDRPVDRRAGGTGPARGDLRPQTGAPEHGASAGDGEGDTRVRDVPTAPQLERQSGAEPGDTGPEHPPGRDAGGPQVPDGDGGLRDSEQRTGRPAPEHETEDTAGPATPGQDTGTPDREVTAEDQPGADASQVDAIPDTGESFRPTGEALAPAGKKAKLAANLAALRVLRELQTEKRSATPAEQTVLSRWAGWGGLPEVFDDRKTEYAKEREELRGLLSPAEWNEGRRNTLNAHYTDPRVVQSVWKAVEDLGFDGGRVLEPGSGSGTFIGFAPPGADMVGVELDSTTAAISRALYPHATIRNESFAKTRLPAGSFDATVGNVPFGQFSLTDRVHNPGQKMSIHNHFIVKSLAMTKPGGVVALLTSRYTLDAQSPRDRKRMAEMGDLIGAVRLPTGSHSKTSGTDVIEDVLIFRRREPGAAPLTPQDWINSSEHDIDGHQITVNDYFTAHPDNVLGELHAEPGQYGTGSLIVKGDRDMPGLAAALDRITEQAKADGATATPRMTDLHALVDADTARHEGHIAAHDDGTFTQAAQGTAVPFDVPDKQAEELRGLIGMRDTLTSLLTAEAASVSDSPQIKALRADLNDQYDAYVKRYGPINRYTLTKTGARNAPGQGGFRRDPMSAIVRALEVYNPETGKAVKTDIFTKRASSPREIPTHADSPADALALCLDTYGEVNLLEIAKMLGVGETAARHQLGDLVFEQPPLTDAEHTAAWTAMREDHGGLADENVPADRIDLSSVGESVRAEGALEPAAAYLSGNVRRKLAAAKAAAAHDDRFAPNVAALEKVIPTDLGVDEVDGRLGAAWIPADDVKAFMVDLLHDGNDRYNSVQVATSGGGIWTVKGGDHGNKATEQWGTSRKSAGELIAAMLEQKPIRVTDTIDGKSYPNLEETLAAQAKADELQERFSEWLFEDSDRTKRLLRSYNDQFNAIRLRSYDDMPRVFPGMADRFVPRDHQVSAVNRIVSEPTALLAHVVGAGKTAEMAMGAAELRRLGMAKKPAIVVPSHMLEQFTREYLQIYPNAKILAAGTDDLGGDKRREFVARAATGQWDCVILTKDAMQLIPMSPEATEAYIAREMATMRAQLEAAQAEGGDAAQQATVKKMEKAVISAEEALRAKLEKTKDAGVSFEQTGIDYLFVDEAHQYSNLRTVSNIQGAGATGSGIATDLHMKIEHLRANNASGRVATFATGTPIRNTVTQAYIMQRFLRPDLLKEAGINSFDQWAATFGQTVDEMELKPEGTGFRQTTRFAKFRNVPELLRLFQIFADVKTAEDLNLPTPKLEGGEVDNVVVPSTDELKATMAELAQRADDYRNGKPQKRENAAGTGEVEDMMLLISMDGRKAAMRQSDKLDIAADKMFAIWEKTKNKPVPKDLDDPTAGDDPPPGGLQIVFSDMFTPGGTGADDFNAYEALRQKLADRGMDPTTIRFMHDAKNDRQKAELFAAARNGQVSVLIGSTEKMGVGTNVQRRAVALHHLDAPWRPSDLEQRDGRIMRQGNANDTISIHRYVTEGSFDAYMWQTLERKKKFIDQIMRGTLDQREIEDVGETALSYAEVKALATGNPLLLHKATVDTTIGKLSRLERTHNRTQTNLRRDVTNYRAKAEADDEHATHLTRAITKRTDTTTGDNFAMTVHGTTTHDRGEAAAMLKASIEDVVRNNYYSNKPKPVAEFGGHRLMAAVDTYYDRSGARRSGVTLTWDGIPDHKAATLGHTQMASIGQGTLATLHNSLHSLESRRDRAVARAEHLRDEAAVMEQRVGVEFPHAQALKEARAESARLSAAMTKAGMSATGESGDSEATKALATARTKAATQATRMGRSGGTAAATLKRFGNSTASPGAVASPSGAIGAFGRDHDAHVFLTDDGTDLRDLAGISSTTMPGVIDNNQALVDDLDKLDLPLAEGVHALYRRWNDYTYEAPDYSKPYEERERIAQAKRDKVKAVEAGDKAAIRAVFARHMVADTTPAKTGVELAKVNAARAATGTRIGDLAKKRLQRFAKASKRIEHYSSDDGTIAAVADTSGNLEYFPTGNGRPLNDPSLERPIADPQAVVNDLAALNIPLGDNDALRERWGKGDGQQQKDLEAIKAVYRRHMEPEEKALISPMDLLRAHRIGVEVKLRADTGAKPAPDAGDAGLEPFTTIVADDVRYTMDASGVLQRLVDCPECGAQMTVPAYGGSVAPPCPACGAVPQGVDSRRAPVG
jgi:N12 class adenine-specific DNA methylase